MSRKPREGACNERQGVAGRASWKRSLLSSVLKDEEELVVGKSWCGLIVEGTAGTRAQRCDAIKGVCGAGATRSKAADILEDPGTKP